jgi:hypothetical protein
MKKELLEYIIRACSKEVLQQLNEAEDTEGAPAPPADGQGTADQPPIPKGKTPISTEPEEPQTPKVPSSPELKGIVLVNPKDKSKLQKVDLKSGDDSSVERSLHKIAAGMAGSKVKIALSTLRLAKDAARNPNTSIYLYIGKYDPQSDELFLMADKSLQVAKDSSVSPAEIPSGMSPMSLSFNPYSANDAELAKHITGGGMRQVQEPVNEELKGMIKKMVTNLINGR